MKQVLWLSCMLAVGVYICGAVIDPDLWWHITVGRWIIANASIPHVDHWNMFGVDKPWRAYSWLIEIVFAKVDALYGIQGLLALQMLMAVLISFSLFYGFSKISGDWFFGALLGAWVTAGCFNHFTLRPQSLVWAYFVWLLIVVAAIEREGPSTKRYLTLGFIMALWANTHLTSVLGILAVVGWLWSKDRGLAIKSGLASFIGTLATPYLGGEWITLFKKTSHPFQHQNIAEFQSATIMQYSTGFLLILIVLLMTFLFRRPRSAHISKLFVGGMYVVAGLAIVKFIPNALIYLAAIAAAIWWQERQDRMLLGNMAEAIERFRIWFNKIPREGLSFLLICVAIVYGMRSWKNPINEDFVPVDTVNFIQEKNLPLPILNDFGRGGYMMYRFSDAAGNPKYLVPIDGRTNVTPHDVFSKFDAALAGKENWKEFLDVAKPETILWPTESALTSILVASEKWCKVFWSGDIDQGFSVLVKHDYWESRQSELPSSNCGKAS